MYHMIADPQSEFEERYACPPALFAKQMRFLRNKGYKHLSLDDMGTLMEQGKSFPPKSVVITFDDGFLDNYENAFPVLLEYGIPATIFLVAGRIGKTNDWMDGKSRVTRKMLTWNHAGEMADHGISMGAHTINHVDLTQMSLELLDDEISGSRTMIEKMLGRKVTSFAYPYGLTSVAVRNAVEKAGFQRACSTTPGFNRIGTDSLMIRRIEVYGTDSLRKFSQKLTFGTNDDGLWFPISYYGSRITHRIRSVFPGNR